MNTQAKKHAFVQGLRAFLDKDYAPWVLILAAFAITELAFVIQFAAWEIEHHRRILSAIGSTQGQ